MNSKIFNLEKFAEIKADQHCNKGCRYVMQGKFIKASKAFKSALQMNKNHYRAQKYLKLVEDVIENKIRQGSVIHLFLGGLYAEEEQWEEAISETKKALSIDFKLTDAHNSLGALYATLGRLDEAIPELRRALLIDPNNAMAHFNLGNAYDEKELWMKAIYSYKKAFNLEPKNAKIHYSLGITYGKAELWDESICWLKGALRIDQEMSEAHNALAIAYYNYTLYDSAIKHCDRAIELGYKVQSEVLTALKPYRKNSDR